MVLKYLPEFISVIDRLIGRGPEVAADIRRTWGRPRALRHQDRDHLLPRVRVPRCTQAAVPTVPSDRPRHIVAPGVDGHAEPPAVAVEVARNQPKRLLRSCQLIGRHDL